MVDIFHITHMDNLKSILDCDGLYCDTLKAQNCPEAIGIAHKHIKERRARRPVPTCYGGTLADYVPFYFSPRSPMLFTIHKGNVDQYRGGQKPILHLVSSSSAVRDAQLPFTFTEGHAEMGYSDFFSDLDDLTKIDWSVMRAVYWNDTDEDGDRKRKRQAEFLVHQFFPWNLIERIGVIDIDTLRAVEAILANREHRPTVTVRRDWYY